MKPRKHAELIKAWADGAEIECRMIGPEKWVHLDLPSWFADEEYRIKPEPKPDVSFKFKCHAWDGEITSLPQIEWKVGEYAECNLILIYDGETGELKSAEVLK